MKALGIILIIAGIVMILFRGFYVETDKEILDAGPIEITKKENRWIGWPTYAGGIAAVAGIVLLISSGKRRGA